MRVRYCQGVRLFGEELFGRHRPPQHESRVRGGRVIRIDESANGAVHAVSPNDDVSSPDPFIRR